MAVGSGSVGLWCGGEGRVVLTEEKIVLYFVCAKDCVLGWFWFCEAGGALRGRSGAFRGMAIGLALRERWV